MRRAVSSLLRGGPPKSERERRLRRRLLPLAVLATTAFIAGAITAAGSPQQDAAERFVRAWANQDFAAMHQELSDEAKARHPQEEMEQAYVAAQRTSTATAIDPGGADGGGDSVSVGIDVDTEIFGDIEGAMEIPFDGEKVAWEPHLVFPNLEPGETVGRRLELPERAPILARDGTPLAEGQGGSRNSPLGGAAIDVAGEVGTPDAELAPVVLEQGLPSDQEVGISGLELAFNPELAGSPGGELLAVPQDSGGGDVGGSVQGRPLGSAESSPGEAVQTTIDPGLQEAAVNALAGQAGGVAVLDARSGSVRAFAGAAFSVPQPPGSTFKIATTVAALEANVVSLNDQFEVTDSVNVGGRAIENSHDQLCGGSFAESFANSCNTVFAPLGPEIGNDKLVEVTERFGFNEKPTLFNEEATEAVDPPEPEIPTEIGDDLDLGVTAIGQGELLATPLVMASMGQTIAANGVRSPTPIVKDSELRADAERVRVTSPKVARTVRDLMVDVVEYGTGVNAAIAEAQVAGKTGTAELGPKPNQPPPRPVAPGEEPPDPEQILDAWFVGFAPDQKPRIVVAVLLTNAEGDGGEVAAPIAAEVLSAGV